MPDEPALDVAADELILRLNLPPNVAKVAARIVADSLSSAAESNQSVTTQRSTNASDRDEFGHVLRFILLQIESQMSQAALEARCYRFAFGFRADNSESLRATAREWGLTPEAISKRVTALRHKHGLGLNSFNKPAALAAKHRITNRRHRNALCSL